MPKAKQLDPDIVEFTETESCRGDLMLMPAKLARAGRKSEEALRAAKIDGVVVGRLVECGDRLLVDFPGNPALKPIPARAAAVLSRHDAGSEAALLFEDGDPLKPLIVGKMHCPDSRQSEESLPAPPLGQPPEPDVEIDGERLTFTADKEIVLRCGKASITLTKAGKVVIKGEYLLNRSMGVNRIKGGSVQIN